MFRWTRGARIKYGVFVILSLLVVASSTAQAQTTQITTEYLMTVYGPLDPPQRIDSSLLIYNVRDGGWAKGPKISAKVIAPGGDWLRVMPSGSARLDIRATFKTDDGALIYTSTNGIISGSKESSERLRKGETLTSKDLYYITAGTMQTSSEKYAWLNHVQCVGKLVEVKAGENGFVKYDIFIVR